MQLTLKRLAPTLSPALGLLLLVSACAPGPFTAQPVPVPTTTNPSPLPAASATVEDPFYEARQRMVQDTIVDRGVSDPDVLRAMRTTPRQAFVPSEYQDQAYADHPLPIGYGQTISQPYIVAWMTELLDLKPGEKVLEVGTGSGYQAAVLAEEGRAEIYSIEIIPELADSASTRLKTLGYTKVRLTQGDGYYGWTEHSPYDAILVTAAPDHLPAPLAEQLTEGGRLVIPIGPPGGYQTLWKFVKRNGELTGYDMGGVIFVPLTGTGSKLNTTVAP